MRDRSRPCRSLGAAAALAIVSHQPELAARDVLVGLTLANSLTETPSILSQLLRSRMIAYSLGALEETVNRCSLPSGGANELFRTFQKMEQTEARGDCFNRALLSQQSS